MSTETNCRTLFSPCDPRGQSLVRRWFGVVYVALALLVWWAFLDLALVAPHQGNQTSVRSFHSRLNASALKPDITSALGQPSIRQSAFVDGTIVEIATLRQGYRQPVTVFADPASDRNDYSAYKSRIRKIQNSLVLAGCLLGPMNGQWDDASRRAMLAFLQASNARLPVNKPDEVLLHHVRGHEHIKCG